MRSRKGLRNHALAARIAELGLRQNELAGLLNDQWHRLYGTEGRCSDRYVRFLLDGTVTWPRSRYRNCLEAVFGCSILTLGFIPSQNEGHGSLAPNSGERDVVKRRDFLRLSVAVGAELSLARYAPLPGVPGSGRITSSDVDKLRSNLGELHTIDDQFGGGAALELAVASSERLEAAASSGRASDKVSRALHGLAGTYLSTAGWLAHDAGDEEASDKYLFKALQAALVAGDGMLNAQTWNYLSLKARGRDPVKAIAIARNALGSTTARKDPLVAALFHCRAARGHAARADKSMALRSIGRAYDALERDDGQPPPPWLEFFDASELVGLTSLVDLELGRYSKARNGFAEMLRLLPEHRQRNRLYYSVDLALANLSLRNIDEASSAAHTVLDVAEQTDSSRGSQMIAALARKMEEVDDPRSADWLERYRLRKKAKDD